MVCNRNKKRCFIMLAAQAGTPVLQKNRGDSAGRLFLSRSSIDYLSTPWQLTFGGKGVKPARRFAHLDEAASFAEVRQTLAPPWIPQGRRRRLRPIFAGAKRALGAVKKNR
jgi:hypothetical protein